MSCIVENLSITGSGKIERKYFIFAKGSPEKVSALSLEKTIPYDFLKQLDKFANKGNLGNFILYIKKNNNNKKSKLIDNKINE